MAAVLEPVCSDLSRPKRHINTTRYLLLDMRDRKGWKALGYESFKEYGEKELGYQENYIHKLVSAAEISLQIGINQDGTIVQPPESQLRPLKSVPEELRKQIWDEATAKAEADGDKRTAKHVETAVAELPLPCGFQITPPETRNPDRRMADRGLYLQLAQHLASGFVASSCANLGTA